MIKTNLIDTPEGGLIIHRSEDVSSALEDNKRRFTSGHDGYNRTRDAKHVASIPLSVVELWMQKYGVNALDPTHIDGVKKLLNSSEWAYLRTSGGRI